MQALSRRKGFVVANANANARSIALGCARAFRDAGAALAATWHTDKSRPHIEPLLVELGADIRLPLDASSDAQMDAAFDRIAARWGRLDFLLHSIAFAPRQDLHGRLIDSSRESS